MNLVNSDTLIDKKVLMNEIKKHGYQCEDYSLGIKVHFNKNQYLDISRLPRYELEIDIYTNGKLDSSSLCILEDRGRIRSSSLIEILDILKTKLISHFYS